MTPKHTQPWSLNYTVTYSYPNWPSTLRPQTQHMLAQLDEIDRQVLEMTEFPLVQELLENIK